MGRRTALSPEMHPSSMHAAQPLWLLPTRPPMIGGCGVGATGAAARG